MALEPALSIGGGVVVTTKKERVKRVREGRIK
jgi:hypothetical protein